MQDLPTASDPFEEIELRQTYLLDRLDELNSRIEQTLREQSPRRADAAETREA